MTPRQRRFVLEYLQDANATRAAIRAGYNRRWANANVRDVLRHPEVRAALDRAIAARCARTGITAERVLDELVRVAFAELGRVVEWRADGARMKPLDRLARDDTAAIAELALGPDGRITRLKLHDKDAALAALARRLGLVDPAARGAAPAGGDARAGLAARIAALA